MGKSAEVIDEKGIAVAPLRERVRKWLKRQRLDVRGWKLEVRRRGSRVDSLKFNGIEESPHAAARDAGYEGSWSVTRGRGKNTLGRK
jgi:hypothetical protein